MNRGKALSEPVLTHPDEIELVRAWQQDGDVVARDRVIRAHYRLCLAVASRFDRNPDHIKDLAQEGSMGLLEAIDKFDPAVGVRFATYSRWYVHNAISKRMAAVNLVVDMPHRVYRMARKGKSASAKATDEPGQATWRAIAAASGDVALDAPLSNEGEMSVLDTLIEPGPTPERNAVELDRQEQMRRSVQEAFKDGMTPREAEVLRRRSMLDVPHTLDAIAKDLGVSRERVRQIEEQAAGKLRRYLVNNGFPKAILRPDLD